MNINMKKNKNRSISIAMHKTQNIKLTTLNLMEEKVVSTLKGIDTGDHFLNITPVAQKLRATINKWNLLKLKCFCKAKDTANRTKQ